MIKAHALYERTVEYNFDESFMPDESNFHRHYEIYYLIKGRRRYVIEDSIYDIEEGDMMLIPPMLMHKTHRIPGTDQNETHERIVFNLREVPEILLPCFERHFYRPDDEVKDQIRALIDESVNEGNKKPESQLLHKINIQKILLILLRMTPNPNMPQNLSERDKLMQNAACYIKEHCREHIALKQIADEMDFTPEYFSSVFKTAMGLNFNEYLNNMRIAKAIHYLNETDLPIGQISEKCGFNDSNYFAIVFKKIVGISPRKYRNSLEE